MLKMLGIWLTHKHVHLCEVPIEAATQPKYQEYICISSQRLYSLLDPSSSRVVQPDDRSSNCHGLVHNLNTECVNVVHSIKDKTWRTTTKYKKENGCWYFVSACFGHLSISAWFTLHIFCAWAPDRLPPKTVKSWEKQKVQDIKNMIHAVMYFHNAGFLLYKFTLYLAEYINQPAIDPASTGHDAVTGELWQRQTVMW